ncbi:DUF2335 domain-containing protein [Melissococcus plutonius]|uniref:DUF2335 domain-containing protein n=1 Tax=Melissococcus plutonius TaxID=33970 RepID=UPI003C2D5AA4
MPHPKILKEYDDMASGSAKLIIENGVAESKHRRTMETTYLNKQVNDKRRSQYLGFSIGLVVIVLGFILILCNHAVTGSALAGASFLGAIGAFTVSNSESDNKESPASE